MLMEWLSSQPFTDDLSSSLASVGARKRRFTRGHSDKSLKKPLQYSPWNGAFTFWYKKHLITFRSMQREDPFLSSKEDMSISCIGRSSKILKELLNECREKYLASVKNKTTIFKHDNGSWDKKNAVAIRQSNSVIIDQKEKTALLEDIKGFLESQPWYSAKGIPHRKGYLFYGPPGTGKSSLSMLIAGECDLDIYILKLSRLDDDSLDDLFGALPERCLVLLEDIDAVDATHSRQHRTVTLRQGDTSSFVKENLHGKVSLSALLNTIDGIGSQEGRLLIMTTNHLERLDEALIRPGRVDMKLELGLTTHDINAQLFFNTFERSAPNDKDKAEEDKELKEIAEEFANKVPENEFSPAEIQLFLVANRKSPAMAVHSLQGWIAKVREEKTTSSIPSLGMTTLHHNGFSGKSFGTIDSSAAQRAPALTNNTADNGAIAQDLLSQDVATTDVIFASQSGIFPYNSTAAQRAPALSNYTADGAMAYDAVGRYRHDWVAAPSPSESGGSGRVQNVALNEAHSSPATPQDCVQARETTNTVAVLETSKTVEKSHCCSCQVIEDIRGICMRERIPSVQLRIQCKKFEPSSLTICRLRRACCSPTSLISRHVEVSLLFKTIRQTNFLTCCSSS
jgi:chaperone BCS1